MKLWLMHRHTLPLRALGLSPAPALSLLQEILLLSGLQLCVSKLTSSWGRDRVFLSTANSPWLAESGDHVSRLLPRRQDEAAGNIPSSSLRREMVP